MPALGCSIAAPWRARPWRADCARCAAGERTRPERRSTRAPSIFNELEIAQHPSNAQRQTALLQPSSRVAVDVPIRARSSASTASSNRTPRQPTLDHCKSLCASVLNQPPAHRAAKSTSCRPQRPSRVHGRRRDRRRADQRAQDG
eukprot:6337593-Prymnesium_polylepis.1